MGQEAAVVLEWLRWRRRGEAEVVKKEKVVEEQSSSAEEEEGRRADLWSEMVVDLGLVRGSIMSVGFGRQPHPLLAVKMLFSL